MNRQGLRRSLLLIATLCLSGCGAVGFSSEPTPQACPAWPVAGAAVAAELSRLDAAAYPATWEWIGRLDKLRRQLEVC